MMGQDRHNRRAIICGVSADHAFALAALMVGVARHNPHFDGDFVVFHDGLHPGQQAELRRLWPNTQFRLFSTDHLTARFGPKVDLTPAYALYSPLIFAKFEMPDLLSTYAECLWLDVDIHVQGDFSALWGVEALAWRPLHQGAFARRAAVMKAFANLRRADYPLLNGGVVGMGRGLCGRLDVADLYAMAAEIMAAVGPHSVDELALYFAACKLGLPLRLLDQCFNHPVVAPGGRDAVLVHAIGPDKFWNAAPLQLAYPEWAQNLKEWAGSGYAGTYHLDGEASPDAALKAARNRAYWADLWDHLRPALPAGIQPDLRSDRPRLRLFAHSLPEAAHLYLTRQNNARRLGIELCFPDEEPLAPAIFARLDGAALAAGKPLELSQNRKGWTYGAVVAQGDCATTLAGIIAALEAA